jgi:hypothetical protein
MLRSCYTTTARLCRGLPRESVIDWYWATCPPIGINTLVNSLNYVDMKERVDTGGVGEIPGRTRSWRDGSVVPAGSTYSCDGPWGTLQDFSEGGLLTLIPPGPDGIPQCCRRCPDWAGLPTVLSLDASGFVDGTGLRLSDFNGHWDLVRDDPVRFPCRYGLVKSTCSIFIDISSYAAGPLLQLNDPYVDYWEGTYDLAPGGPPYSADPTTFPFLSSDPLLGGSVAATLTLTPSAFCFPAAAGIELTTEGGNVLTTEGGDPLTT